MRKIKILAALLICGTLFSCGENTEENVDNTSVVESEVSEEQTEETPEETAFEVSVEDLSEDDTVFHEFVLTVTDNNEKYTYNLFKAYSCEEPVLCDVDGDGRNEIVVNELAGLSGGAGSYCSYIFRYDKGSITPIFESAAEDEQFDTGFSTTLKDGSIVEISNRITGFSFTVDYYRSNRLFNEDGTVADGMNDTDKAIIDTFNQFYPEDIDNDGVSEIFCQQYIAMSSHVEYIGDAISYLKYNNDSQQFEVIKSDFRKAEIQPR